MTQAYDHHPTGDTTAQLRRRATDITAISR